MLLEQHTTTYRTMRSMKSRSSFAKPDSAQLHGKTYLFSRSGIGWRRRCTSSGLFAVSSSRLAATISDRSPFEDELGSAELLSNDAGAEDEEAVKESGADADVDIDDALLLKVLMVKFRGGLRSEMSPAGGASALKIGRAHV